MFNKNFFPTPLEVINIMMEGENIQNKVILEPSGGKGDIVDYLTEQGAKTVISCENNEDLRKILQTKCTIIEPDFLALTSDKISHIDFIVMNPPFDADETHILHAFNIAPAGCKIIALCNHETASNPFTKSRKELKIIIETYGEFTELGDCFTDAERKTGVNVGLIKIQKAGTNEKTEFEGFFLDEEPEERQENGLITYNVVRDLVNRYINACKIYKEALSVKDRLNIATGNFFNGLTGIQMECNYDQYKKELQKSGWKFVFDKMNMRKNTTRGLNEEINKFVEQQYQIPFTMRNIYHMIDIVIQTTGQRMDKAILEAFDNITAHHHDNRQYLKGWKTNSHFLVGKKFILPDCVKPAKEYGYTSTSYSYLSSYKTETIEDLEKALCFANGINYDDICPAYSYNMVNTETPSDQKTLKNSINSNTYGEYYNSYFFKYKAFKNGNMHFEFISEDIRGKFNQKVAELKGFPLYEAKAQTAYQNRQTGRKPEAKTKPVSTPSNVTILKTIKLKTA